MPRGPAHRPPIMKKPPGTGPRGSTPAGGPQLGSGCPAGPSRSHTRRCAPRYGFGCIATGSFVIPRSFFCFSTIFATSARSFFAS